MSSKSFSYSSSSVSYFSSSTSRNGQTTGSRYAAYTSSDPSGTTTRTASQRAGGPVYTERRDYDASGRLITSEGRRALGGAADAGRRIEDVTDEEQQRENDRLYKERMEEEYAKREGGA
ncbi:hypothetical protein F5X99DRAFT_365730 [Biscogniauxia marginata]|nr:hypothetical protein F5X99DRAFT_365730 [Biscogniauxia marginata]